MKPLYTSFTPGYKIAYLFLFLLIGIFAAGILTNLILKIPGLNDVNGVNAIYIASILQSLLATALPAYFVARFTQPDPLQYLKMYKSDRMGEKVLFAIFAFIASYAFASFLAQWNKGMQLPSSLYEVERVFRSMEDAALATTNLLLSGKTVITLILNLVVVALFAALSEELFFRGALQQFVEEKFSNKHVAVWITAVVFSLVHFQFFGFLPRLLLGALLGYLFIYTQNLWMPIIFHFINNALIVVIHFFWGDNEWLTHLEDLPVNGWYLLVAIISGLCTILLFVGYNKFRNNFQNIDNDTNSTYTPV